MSLLRRFCESLADGATQQEVLSRRVTCSVSLPVRKVLKLIYVDRRCACCSAYLGTLILYVFRP
jgi:hypothetical protein